MPARIKSKASPHPARKAPRRRKLSPGHVVIDASLPKGFGGLDGSRTISVVLADAMLSKGGMYGILTWIPPARLPSFRDGLRRVSLAHELEKLGIDPTDVVACSTDRSDYPSVTQVVDFLAREGDVEEKIKLEAGMTGAAVKWSGILLLIVHCDGIHVIAPRIVPPTHLSAS